MQCPLCLWLLLGCILCCFGLSLGVTWRSDHFCYAGVCGSWLFPTQARIHVGVWYAWLLISTSFLALRATNRRVRTWTSKGFMLPKVPAKITVGGIALVLWQAVLYAVLLTNWWPELRRYFTHRGHGLPGNILVAFVAQSGHLADVTMGLVLLPVTRHGALAQFFRLQPSTNFFFHMCQAYLLFVLVVVHGLSYAGWVAHYNQAKDQFRQIFPVLNPTYLYHEVWPGNRSALGTWRASLIFSGIAASLIMTAMLVTSFPIMRRKYFNVFYFTHLFGILAIVIVCLHASTMFYCTAPGLLMWLLDWGLRTYELKKPLESRLRSLGKGWYSLTVHLPAKRFCGCREIKSPLAHFHIHHAATSKLELHPFTTTTHLASQQPFVSSDGKEYVLVEFLFREMDSRSLSRPLQPSETKRKQWTSQLASLATVGDSSTVEPVKAKDFASQLMTVGRAIHPALRSSFGETEPESQQGALDIQDQSQAEDETSGGLRSDSSTKYDSADDAEKGYRSDSSKDVDMFSGSTTPGTSASDTQAEDAGVRLTVRLEGPYFTAAHPMAFDTVVCLVAGTGITGAIAIASGFRAQQTVHSSTTASTFDEERQENTQVRARKAQCTRCIVVWCVRADDFVKIPVVSELQNDGLDLRIHRTGGGAPRPSISGILHDICQQDGSRTWAYVCGPKGFVMAAERACMSISGLTWTATT